MFSSHHYRFDPAGNGEYVLHRSSGITTSQPDDYVGTSYHDMETLPGDSGSPMLAGRDELVGMRIGMLQESAERPFRPISINGRQILNYLLAADMLSKRKGGFLGSEKARMLSARKARKNVLKLYRKMTRGAYDDAGGGLSSEGSSNRMDRPLTMRTGILRMTMTLSLTMMKMRLLNRWKIGSKSLTRWSKMISNTLWRIFTM